MQPSQRYLDSRLFGGERRLCRSGVPSTVRAPGESQPVIHRGHVGIEPREQKILALKSSVHFRADFQPIAEEILIVAAPGANPVDNRALPYQRIRKGIRLMPLAEPFTG